MFRLATRRAIALALGIGLVTLLAASPAPSQTADDSAKKTATENETTEYTPGFAFRIYQLDRSLSAVPELVAGQTPNSDEIVPHLHFSDDRDAVEESDTVQDFAGFEELFLAVATGRLTVPTSGEYTFRLTSDDGSLLFIDDKEVIDNDGLHASEAEEGTIQLDAGAHSIEVRHFENGGEASLELEWRPPGATEFSLLTAEHVSTPSGLVRVTSPGTKKFIYDPVEFLPGDGHPLVDVHPSYRLVNFRPDDFRPRVGGLDHLSDGRIVVSCWDAEGRVYLVDESVVDEHGAAYVHQIASGLAEPLGLCVVDDRIFVCQKQELTELIDHDGDDVIDEYRCVSDDWTVSANFHEFTFGLVHKDGWLYLNLAVAIDPGGKTTDPQVADRGRTLRVNIESGEIEFLNWGLRTPDGIGIGPDGEIFITDNQGDWLPSSKIIHLETGAFHGARARGRIRRGDGFPTYSTQRAAVPPVAWMPHNEIGNSPGEPARFVGAPFDGQLAVSDVTHGGIKRVFLEKVNGRYQGTVFRFTQGLEAGTHRMRILPDGSIYVGGIGSGGNWGQSGKLRYGLQKLVPNGEPTFEMRAVRSLANGLEIEFTESLAPGDGWNVDRYEIEHFRYEPTEEYGGPKIDVTSVTPTSATVSADRTRVFLEFEPVAGRVYALRLSTELRSEHHRALWSTEAWLTLNAIADDRRGEPRPAPASLRDSLAENRLTDEERALGWKLLFDGESTREWRGFLNEEFPSAGWSASEGTLRHAPGAGGGDILTRERYRDFEFECECASESTLWTLVFVQLPSRNALRSTKRPSTPTKK